MKSFYGYTTHFSIHRQAAIGDVLKQETMGNPTALSPEINTLKMLSVDIDPVMIT
jgi:hypothetical protein